MQILIIEDDPVSRRILESLLKKWGYDTVSAENGLEAWEQIQSADVPNLIISDWMMPNLTGVELCERIRKLETAGYIYFILLTTKNEKKDLIQGLESGADDFIIKPFDKEELRSRIKIGERIITLEQRIIALANTDYLTGVLNRRAFMDQFGREILRCRRQKYSLSVIMTDIDFFKSVNDEHGHLAGDFVLKRFAEIIGSGNRPYDFMGRYGGEEFVFCLPETDITQAAAFAERMRQKIAQAELNYTEEPHCSIRITASFGVFSSRADHDYSPESFIKAADDALYRAKENGRNRVEADSGGRSVP